MQLQPSAQPANFVPMPSIAKQKTHLIRHLYAMLFCVFTFSCNAPASDPTDDAAVPASGVFLPLALVADDVWQRFQSPTLPIELPHARIEDQIFSLLTARDSLQNTLRRAEPYLFHIVQAIENAGLPIELALLPAIESTYLPSVKSPAGAAGLWQFMPATASRYKLPVNDWYDARLNPLTSTSAAIEVFHDLDKRYQGDWLLALAAYNAGPATVDRAIAKVNHNGAEPVTYWDLKLPSETMTYVPRFLALAKVVSEAQFYALPLPSIANRPHLTAVTMPRRFSLTRVARITGLSPDLLTSLNTHLVQGISPPDGPHYLTLPLENARHISSELEYNPHSSWHELPTYHRVVAGDSLSVIAERYSTSVSALQKANGLKSADIKIGVKLIVGYDALEPDAQALSIPSEVEPRTAYQYGTHVVKQGDSLWNIAKSLDSDLSSLQHWNKLENTESILSIGTRVHVAALKTSNKKVPIFNYRTRHGDTLNSISTKFGIPGAELRRHNKALLQHGQTPRPGQQLRVPTPLPVAHR